MNRDRRRFIATAASFGVAGALAACAGTGPEVLAPARFPSGSSAFPGVLPLDAPLRPIQSSMGRVTRTIVGLRPFRIQGPRLESATLGDKSIVHNYGHGGGGVSLSWGVAEMASARAKAFGHRSVAVLGSGAIGLSTAIELAQSGAEVTIYARDFPPYTTSNVAGAMWHPVTLYEEGQASAATLAMLDEASRIAFRRFIGYANDPAYGVYWIRQYGLSQRPMDTQKPYVGGDALYPGLRRNVPGGPFGFAFHDAFYTLMIDPDIYLRALVRDFSALGGRLVQMDFAEERDLQRLPEKTVVNCLGLGAAQVFGDEQLLPARGQLSFLLPQPEIDYGYAGVTAEHGLLYSFPRKTGVLLGGSVGKGDWSLAPREDEIRRMVEGHALLAAGLS